MTGYAEEFMDQLIKKTPAEPEFHQAVQEVLENASPIIESKPEYRKAKIMERLAEPERVIIFSVPWVDDKGEVQINTGYRVQMNSTLGPYKGGLRFRHTVTLGILKFLAFEQTFKNALTGLPLGGGKGGSDFDPKNKSDGEIMRFCQSFMNEFFRYIGPNTDIPAGDIGVGAREIGYLLGQYKKLTKEFSGSVLTGKKPAWGGSQIRREATGYGTVYFAEEMLNTRNESIKGKIVTISGSGNVAQYAAEKIIQLGGKVVTLSDSNGTVVDCDGIDNVKLAWIMELKSVRRGRIREYAEHFPRVKYLERKKPWGIKCDIAFPCATQNEITAEDAKTLVENGCICVSEGANMPTGSEGIKIFQEAKILYGVAKAANAGGVSVSGLEMAQNAQRLSWRRTEVEERLKEIMKSIHETCVKHGRETDGYVNYVKGANIASFIKLADAMLDQGV